MGSLEPTTLALITKFSKYTTLSSSGTITNAKMISFKYQGSQKLPEDSDITIKTEMVNIWGPWLTKNETAASLYLY